MTPIGRLTILFCAFVAGVPALLARAAWADCTDIAAPGVDWRRCYLDGKMMRGADLQNAKLRDATFARADLSGSNLSGIDGFRAKFLGARLVGTHFDDAQLAEADFTNADLTSASLHGANLRRARFFRAVLRDSDLTGAHLVDADLLNADLSGATWTDGKRKCSEGSLGQCNFADEASRALRQSLAVLPGGQGFAGRR